MLAEVPRRPARRRRSSRGGCSTAKSSRSACRSAARRPAQQIVAIAADDPWATQALYELVTARAQLRELSRELFTGVLDMLAGRYPSDEFADLRPRVVWDRARDMITARKDARLLAVVNAGTIPDRGLFAVHLGADGPRIGELDEEMVHESRVGETFLLGASSWRIEEITRDRVIVEPGAGRAGQDAVLARRGPRTAARARPRARRVRRCAAASASRSDAQGVAAARLPARSRAPPTTSLPTFASSSEATGELPTDRHHHHRAFSRRARRLARLHPVAVRRARARAVGAGVGGALGRDRSASTMQPLVDRRRHRRCASPTYMATTIPSRPNAPCWCPSPTSSKTLLVARARARRMFASALSRERGARALAAAPSSRPAHAAVGAAVARAAADGRRAAISSVPDHARDLSRVPARRVRCAGADRAAARRSARARCASSKSRRRARRRSRARSCSTTSRPSSTRATRRSPSARRRR